MHYRKVILAPLAVILACSRLSQASPETAPAQPQFDPTLPALTQPELRKLPPPLREPDIPSAFLGCWEGNPIGFDEVLADPDAPFSTRFRQIVLCFTSHSVVVPQVDLSVVKRQGVLDFILSHIGLGYVRSRVTNVKSDLYQVSGNQVLARTIVTLEVTESWIYKLPSTRHETVVDEELATVTQSVTAAPASMLVTGRQFLEISGHRTLAAWHAPFRHW